MGFGKNEEQFVTEVCTSRKVAFLSPFSDRVRSNVLWGFRKSEEQFVAGICTSRRVVLWSKFAPRGKLFSCLR